MKSIISSLKKFNQKRLEKRRERKVEKAVLQEKPDLLILSPPHCLYLANEMRMILKTKNLSAHVTTHESTSRMDALHHIIICPQVFKRIPPDFTAFQMEQSGSSNWFTPEYLATLKKARFVLDYSKDNVQYLALQGVRPESTRYMPIDFTTQHQPTERSNFRYDVVFYGNIESPRRKMYLDAISRQFNTLVINNSHGPDLINKLLQAKCVVNIHYYENVLLETTRLYECLSNDLMVVSEKAKDQEHHQGLENIIEFTEIGDVNDMITRIQSVISNEDALRARIKANAIILKNRRNIFLENFSRFVDELAPPTEITH